MSTSSEVELYPTRRLSFEARRRLSPNISATVPAQSVAQYQEDGWAVDKRLSKSIRMIRPKQPLQRIEDIAWSMLARIGFHNISGEGGAPWLVPDRASTKIDIFAADDETALVAICRYFDPQKPQSFRREIEFLETHRGYIHSAIRRNFDSLKVKFLLITNNCLTAKNALEELDSHRIAYFNEDTIDYFSQLIGHLGAAAKYQLLGSIFAGQKIPELDSRVPAIEARMGSHTYYSFAIEPERLLKLAYILHRTRSSTELLPTYQRLIRRQRLNSISRFVESGGIFPNCVIINIDAGRRVNFDLVGGQSGISRSRMGVLHLPQRYRAAYVIDGQHRLYGYANSTRSRTDLIPVVAFVNLEPSEQVRLFMQINENQQAVPKNLRLTLNADILATSTDFRERARAVILQAAQRLGESTTSPLYSRVLIGESPKTQLRCITIDAIRRGIERGGYLGEFSRNGITRQGVFWRGDNDGSRAVMTGFLELCLSDVRERIPEQWRIGSGEGGFLWINNGVEALIRVFHDAVVYTFEDRPTFPLQLGANELFHAISPVLDALGDHLQNFGPEEGREYRRQYGSGGSTLYWRRLQAAIRRTIPEFNPPGLEEFIADEEKRFNSDSTAIVREIESFLKEDVRTLLKSDLGKDWWRLGVPKNVQLEAGKLRIEKNLDLPADEQVDEWDCLYLIDYHKILTMDHDRWIRLFQKRYTPPGDEEQGRSWKKRADWLQRLKDIRNSVMHGGSVKEHEYEFLLELKSWLIDGNRDNDL